MIRNQFSYWLTASPLPGASTDPKAVLDALSQSGLAWPGGPMIFSLDDNKISGEVNPDEGTTEEDTSLKDTVAKIAARFPDFEFVFDENDEDDHSNQATAKYSGGKCIYEAHARTLGPGEYDQPTVDAITAYLAANGWADAANAVRRRDFAKS